MIVSQRRIEANRRNALRSTGPRTAAGKARSSRNRTTHGLGGHEIRLTKAEQEARRRLRREWFDHYRPRCDAERAAIAAATHAQIVLRRIRRLDAEMHAGSPRDAFNPDAIRLLLNHEKPWANAFHRAVALFQRLRRQHELQPPISTNEPTAIRDETPYSPEDYAPPEPPEPATDEPSPAEPPRPLAPARPDHEPGTEPAPSRDRANETNEPTAKRAAIRLMSRHFGKSSGVGPPTDEPSVRRRGWVGRLLRLAGLRRPAACVPPDPGRESGETHERQSITCAEQAYECGHRRRGYTARRSRPRRRRRRSAWGFSSGRSARS